MAKFHLTDQSGAKYEIDAPDEHAAVTALSQIVNPNTGAGAFSEAAPPAPRVAADEGAFNAFIKGAPLGLPFGDRALAAGQTIGARFGSGDSPDYSTNLDRVRRMKDEIGKDHPGTLLSGELLGSIAGPFAAMGAASRASGLGMKTLTGATANGGVGAVQGLSDAPDMTDLRGVVKHVLPGAVGGAVVGSALPVFARGIGSASSAIINALMPNNSGISKGAIPHLLSALEADTPAAVQSSLDRLGPHAMLADAGPAFLGKGQGSALNSDVGRTIMANALSQRKAGANSRIQSSFDDLLGPAEDPVIATQNILNHRSEVDSANYSRAYANAPPVDATGVLALIGQRLDGAEGMQKKALLNLRSALMEPKEFPKLNPDGSPVFVNGVAQTESRNVPKTAIENLHNIRQEIDNVINHDAPGLGVPAGALQNQQGALKQVRGALDDALKSDVPGFAQADVASSALARRAEAVQTGTSVLDSGKTAMTPERLQSVYDAMAPGERAALAKGARGEIERQLDTKANDLVAGKNVIKGEGDWNRQRLETVFGEEPTDKVIGVLDSEAKFNDTYNKIVENSQTAQRTAAARSMKPEPSSETPFFSPSSTFVGMTTTGLKKGVMTIVNALTKSDPTKSYGEVAKILSAQGPARDAYVSNLIDILDNKETSAWLGQKLGNNAALLTALSGNGYLRHQLQNQ